MMMENINDVAYCRPLLVCIQKYIFLRLAAAIGNFLDEQ